MQPCHDMTTKLYVGTDPEDDPDFDEKVHGRNEADAQMLAHARNCIMPVLETLKAIHGDADHILGTEADHPLEVARANAKVIRSLASAAIARLTVVTLDD